MHKTFDCSGSGDAGFLYYSCQDLKEDLEYKRQLMSLLTLNCHILR